MLNVMPVISSLNVHKRLALASSNEYRFTPFDIEVSEANSATSASSQYTPPVLLRKGLVAHQTVVAAPCGIVFNDAATSGSRLPSASQKPIF